MSKWIKGLVISICAVVMTITMTGCTQSDGDESTIKEIETLNEKWLSVNKEGDYESLKNYLDDKLQEQFAPIVLYTNFTSQYPESQSCQKNAMEVAEYVMTRLYQDAEVEKVSISQDKSEARVLMAWKGIDTDKVDITSLKDTINNIIEEQYQSRKDEYDANTVNYGEESTKILLQEDAFDKVFEQIMKLYKKAPDKEMHGVLSYSYKTGEGYKLSGITQYLELLYHEDGTYNWEYEQAQTTFDKDKAILEQENATQ